MSLSDKQWFLTGCAILAGLSSLILLGRIPIVLLPMPFPLVLMAFVSNSMLPAVIPILYAVFLMLALASRHFAKAVLALVVIVAALNFVYFYSFWVYGLTYQGKIHTIAVAIENLIGFAAAMVMAMFSIKNGSRQIAHLANLMLFMLLSWCAFPYLGELA